MDPSVRSIAAPNPPGQEIALKARLQKQADTDLLASLVRGIFAYPVLIIALATTTSFAAQHGALFWTCTIALTLALSFRAVLAILCRRIYVFNTWLMRWPLAASVWLCSGVCGLLYVCCIHFYGFDSWTFTMVMIWMVGIASGSTISFTPNFRLLLFHIFLMFGPAALISLYLGGKKGYGIAFATSVLCSFLLMQGRNLHKVYWKWLDERAQETARTAELEVAKQAAESASISKGQFLANMSHEIRTPMHGILGMANLAIESTSPQEAREYMQVLSRSAEGLLHVLNDILDFSKIEAGKLSLETVPFSLRRVVSDTKDILTPQAKAKRIALDFTVAPEIHDQFIGDPARLRQVLVNLLGNAVKFTSVGSVMLTVTKNESQSAGQETLTFRVTDTGIGIPREQQELIFAPFAQADSSVTRNFGDTGLGLSICCQLIEMMGGKLGVESTPQVGSTFYFSSSFTPADDKNQTAASFSDVEPMPQLRIMVAEDNVVSQKLAARLLTRAGHKLKLVATGKEALRAWEEEDFDVILMDNQMPEMDGTEAVRIIRQREIETGRTRTHIVACSASAMAGDRERFLASGMDSYLGKPFHAEELYAAIRDAASQPVI